MKFDAIKRLGLSVFTLAALFSLQPAFVSVAQAQETELAIARTASSVDVTVYADGFAQVEELRSVKLNAGFNRIQLDGIAARYRHDSLSIIDASGPGEFKFKKATYQPATLTAERLLELSVGKQVTATVGSGATARTVTGTLVSVRGGQLIITTAGGATHLANASDVELGALPAGLSNSASLVIEANVAVAGTYDLHFLYETDGLGWTAKHTLVYNEDKQSVESFKTTVNVINNSGTTFENANLWLLSGNVQQPRLGGRLRSADYAAPAAAMVQESASVESVGERKTYRIPGRVTIGSGLSDQLPLFTGANVTVQHEYFVPASHYYGENTALTPVNVRLKLKNCAEHNLGSPLPAGSVKVLQRNSESKLQLTASAVIKEIARDEVFEIGLGTSSDVKAERIMIKTSAVAPTGPAPRLQPGQQAPEWQDQDFEVKVHNFKDKKAVDVIVEVAVPADQNNIAPLTRVNAGLGTSTVHVDAGKNATLTYTLRVRIR